MITNMWIDVRWGKPEKDKLLLCYHDRGNDAIGKYYSGYSLLRHNGKRFYQNGFPEAYCQQDVTKYLYVDELGENDKP